MRVLNVFFFMIWRPSHWNDHTLSYKYEYKFTITFACLITAMRYSMTFNNCFFIMNCSFPPYVCNQMSTDFDTLVSTRLLLMDTLNANPIFAFTMKINKMFLTNGSYIIRQTIYIKSLFCYKKYNLIRLKNSSLM